MAEDVETLTRKTVENGGVLAMLYFDIHAQSEEAVKDLGTGFINSVIQKPGVVFALGEIDKPVEGEGENKNWSSSISLKVLTEDFIILANLCMAHSPFSVEILKPDSIKLELNQAHDLLGNMAATTAEYKRYILMKMAKAGEIASIEETLKKRAEMGKKVLKEKKGEE
jgi:hypothetical protein